MSGTAEQAPVASAPVATPKSRDPLATPMIRQYLELKSTVPECILFFRMGDFYEMFLEDAQRAAPVLGLQLTSRNKGDPDEVPLCGFPHTQLEEYLGKMIAEGFKVAVGEQVEAPAPATSAKSLAPKIFKREIVRIVTPGLLTQGESLAEMTSSRRRYLLAICPMLKKSKSKNLTATHFGLAYLDISTGEFRVTEFIEANSDSPKSESRKNNLPVALSNEIARLDPSEVLLPDMEKKDFNFAPAGAVLETNSWVERLENYFGGKVTLSRRNLHNFDGNSGRLALCELFKTHSLAGFGLEDFDAGLGAAGAILEYVQATQKRQAIHICALKPYRLEETLKMDASTRSHLELDRGINRRDSEATLLDSMDACFTRQGKRLLQEWLSSPLVNSEDIERRYDAVEKLQHGLNEGTSAAERLQGLLKNINDLERLCSRLALGTTSPRDCLALGQSLTYFPEIANIVGAISEGGLFQKDQPGPVTFDANLGLLGEIRVELMKEVFPCLAAIVLETIADDAPNQWREKGGFIRQGYHAQLDELRELMHNTKGFISAIERREREKTGINSLKIRYNNVFGYFIEVTKSHLQRVPDYFIRKQTLVNAERFIIPELKELEERLLRAEGESRQLEQQLFGELQDKLKAEIPLLIEAAHALARLDVLFNFARQSFEWNYVRPRLTERSIFKVRGARHPVLERVLKRESQNGRGERFIPNDLAMDVDARQILLITGPNMAGKSTVMRQLALIVIMAQAGSFIPVEDAELGLVDGIYTRVGASDRLSLGESTFMVEMNETANILHNATPKSLVILDEIGRGTSTYDGLSIAWAVAEYLHEEVRARTLFATHYHELAILPKKFPRVINCNVGVKEWNDRIIFLRKLVDGATNRSYGLHVARLAGLPDPVLKRAKEVLQELEAGEEKGNPSGKTRQIDLFNSASEDKGKDEENNKSAAKLAKVLEQLTELAVDHTPPLEALQRIAEWQRLLRSK